MTGQVPRLPEGPGQKSPAFPLLPQGLKPACFFLRPEDKGSGPARPTRTGSGQPAQVSRPRGKISDGGSCDVLTGHGAEPRADRWEVRPRFCTAEAAAHSGSLVPGAGKSSQAYTQTRHPALRHSAPHPLQGYQRPGFPGSKAPVSSMMETLHSGDSRAICSRTRRTFHFSIPVETLGTKTQAPRLGKDLLRWGEHNRDANADLQLRRLKGTLAGKEWFVPISWNDQGCD